MTDKAAGTNYFRLRAEDFEIVKLLTQRWVDAEVAKALKDGAVGARMKFILRVAENQCIRKHMRISRWRQRYTGAYNNTPLMLNTERECMIPCTRHSCQSRTLMCRRMYKTYTVEETVNQEILDVDGVGATESVKLL